MSSVCSEVDVIRTRIPTYDDNSDTDLYAYEPNFAFFNTQERALPDNEDPQETIRKVFYKCQAIYCSIQELHQKYDVISEKISKIHRLRAKGMLSAHKSSGCTERNDNLSSRKLKNKKPKKIYPADLNRAYSYSPTIPVGQRDSDFQTNCDAAASLNSEVPNDMERPLYDEHGEVFSQSPGAHSAFSANAYHSYYSPDEDKSGRSLTPCFSSPRVSSNGSLYSPSRPAAEASPECNSGEHCPDALEDKNNTQNSLCIPSGLDVGNSPVFGRGKKYFKDPSAWSVEEVIKFLKRSDPQISLSLIEIFRQQDIDGKALLLLKSDIMMRYLGLKLGTAVKLCYYIERLKQDHYLKH